MQNTKEMDVSQDAWGENNDSRFKNYDILRYEIPREKPEKNIALNV